jgi:sugar phosphate isomerase/epimerase
MVSGAEGMRDLSSDPRWLSINTATIRKSCGEELPLPRILDALAARGIQAFAPWRDQVASTGVAVVRRQVSSLGLTVSGYCRGGMFSAADVAGLRLADEDNLRALDEACELGAACLILVVGALPGALQGYPASKDIGLARTQVRDGIFRLLEHARAAGMPLALEPLHPMYAADRACVNTLEHALDLCDELDPSRSGALGVAVDVYHVWWDPKLQAQIERAGRDRLLAFHICDWLTPTRDLLNDRGMMGDGVIDIPRIRQWMEMQGFAGYCEVEIFSADHWWLRPHEEVLDTCIARYRSFV